MNAIVSGKAKTIETLEIKGLCNNYQEGKGGGGGEKLGGGLLHKIAAKIGGLKVKTLI